MLMQVHLLERSRRHMELRCPESVSALHVFMYVCIYKYIYPHMHTCSCRSTYWNVLGGTWSCDALNMSQAPSQMVVDESGKMRIDTKPHR